MNAHATPTRSPWAWIPTLYFGQGIPYVVVMTLSVVLYKNLGVSNADIALYTSWLYLPWVIKPLWSPLVDMFKTKRFWIVTLQFAVAVSLGLVALTLPMPLYFQMTLAMFWLMAFASATHDIAADGFYMLALPQHQQAAFVGVRSTFYRAANIVGQGVLVWLAGSLAQTTGNVQLAWTIVFTVLAVLFLLLFVYHRFVLPRPTTDTPVLDANGQASIAGVGRQFGITFSAFFRNPNIWLILTFLLTYRLGEAQALKLIAPFILDPANKGGLGLDNKTLGLVYGTLGVAALTVGGLVGGFAISRKGLKFWLWPMMLCVHIPNLVFVYMAATQPTNIAIVAACIMIEQLGYGFGFAAYLMFMIMVADGGADGRFESLGSNPHKTAHYSICTGFMALGMMLPGMVSGYIQAAVGYTHFFVWVCICTIPSMLVAIFLKIDPRFGKKDVA